MRPPSSGKPPVLVFSYGGGTEHGDRTLKNTNNLVYANLGAFFALLGFLTVIPDYRAVALGAKYPEPIEDVRDALQFIVNKLSKECDTRRIFLLGHSAGVLMQSSLLLRFDLLPNDLRSRIKGVVWNGGVYHFHFPRELGVAPPAVLEAFYGPSNGVYYQTPLGLLQTLAPSLVAALPPMLFFTAENDPEEMKTMKGYFVQALQEKGFYNFAEVENPKHNHMSSVCALCSGEGAEWGFRAVEWMRAIDLLDTST